MINVVATAAEVISEKWNRGWAALFYLVISFRSLAGFALDVYLCKSAAKGKKKGRKKVVDSRTQLRMFSSYLKKEKKLSYQIIVYLIDLWIIYNLGDLNHLFHLHSPLRKTELFFPFFCRSPLYFLTPSDKWLTTPGRWARFFSFLFQMRHQ